MPEIALYAGDMVDRNGDTVYALQSLLSTRKERYSGNKCHGRNSEDNSMFWDRTAAEAGVGSHQELSPPSMSHYSAEA